MGGTWCRRRGSTAVSMCPPRLADGVVSVSDGIKGVSSNGGGNTAALMGRSEDVFRKTCVPGKAHELPHELPLIDCPCRAWNHTTAVPAPSTVALRRSVEAVQPWPRIQPLRTRTTRRCLQRRQEIAARWRSSFEADKRMGSFYMMIGTTHSILSVVCGVRCGHYQQLVT